MGLKQREFIKLKGITICGSTSICFTKRVAHCTEESKENMPTEKLSRDKREWFNIGIARDKEGDFKGAAKAYMHALQIDPNYTDAWVNMGIVRHELGDYRAAIKAYDQALTIKPKDASVWFNLALARFALQDLKGAVNACEQARVHSPEDPDLIYTLACYCALIGATADALKYLKFAIKLEPKLVEVARQEKDFDSIRESFEFHELVGIFKRRKPKSAGEGSAVVEKKHAAMPEKNIPPIMSKVREILHREEKSIKTPTLAPPEAAKTPTPTPQPKPVPPIRSVINKEKTVNLVDPAPVAWGERKTHVRVMRQFEYIGGKVRIKINVLNLGSQGHLRLRAALDLPQSFKLLRVDPTEYARDGSAIKLGDLLPNEEKAAAWVLEPLICGKEMIGGIVSGVDADGTPFAHPMNPLEVEVRCPLFVRPEEANLPIVQRMLGDLSVHSERSYLLPKTLAPDDAFELAKMVIAERDVRFVGIFTGEATQSFDRSAVFYGITKVKQKRFVITTSVSEEDRAIRISSACDEEEACTGFLAELGARVRRELVSRGAVDSEEHVKELVCEKCGTTLPRAPIVGRDVACPECRWTWRFSDFYQ